MPKYSYTGVPNKEASECFKRKCDVCALKAVLSCFDEIDHLFGAIFEVLTDQDKLSNVGPPLQYVTMTTAMDGGACGA